jgi:hypothetical protein
MHKVAGARQAMEAVGAKVLYLSPYSPDLNPTKMALTEPKALVGCRARTSRPPAQDNANPLALEHARITRAMLDVLEHNGNPLYYHTATTFAPITRQTAISGAISRKKASTATFFRTTHKGSNVVHHI